ncbi:MAG: SGNH/GDSL hydrolase family protein [Lachnospiraceae bacterium]|nr:SGNH/GDSL hydrolase family protein [Lachnospiraceae bacterium]
MKKKGVRLVLTMLVAVLVLWFLQRLLMPKYMSGIPEGAMIAEYYDSEKIHDVIFLGDCEVYEAFSPCYLWERYGISSYVRGSAQQLIWQSYYLLEDTLQYETPEAVVFNIMSLMHGEPQNEAYNRMTLDGMRWSASKWKAVQASMLEEESVWEYVFPLLRYHTRWQELGAEDVKYLFSRDKVTWEGYLLRVETKPVTVIPEPRELPDYTFSGYAMEYLEKLRVLCEKKGIELIFVKAPSLYPHWYEEWEQQVDAYAAEHGIAYYNFLELAEEAGIDYRTDTYDGGLHMNLSGAEKLSDYLGKKLVEVHGIPVRTGEETYQDVWEPKVKLYHEEIEKKKSGVPEYE